MQPIAINDCQFLGTYQHRLSGQGADADGIPGYIASLEWISCHASH
jgi:hypothetical protein